MAKKEWISFLAGLAGALLASLVVAFVREKSRIKVNSRAYFDYETPHA